VAEFAVGLILAETRNIARTHAAAPVRRRTRRPQGAQRPHPHGGTVQLH